MCFFKFYINILHEYINLDIGLNTLVIFTTDYVTLFLSFYRFSLLSCSDIVELHYFHNKINKAVKRLLLVYVSDLQRSFRTSLIVLDLFKHLGLKLFRKTLLLNHNYRIVYDAIKMLYKQIDG